MFSISWLFSIISHYIPNLWILPAFAAGVVYFFSLGLSGATLPYRISAELLKLLSAGLTIAAVYMYVWASATSAAEERFKAELASAKAAQAVEVQKAVEESRKAAAEAEKKLTEAEGRLSEELAKIPPTKPKQDGNYGGGLSPSTVRSIMKVRGK